MGNELEELKRLAKAYVEAVQATQKSYGVSQEEYDLCDLLEDKLLEAIKGGDTR